MGLHTADVPFSDQVQPGQSLLCRGNSTQGNRVVQQGQAADTPMERAKGVSLIAFPIPTQHNVTRTRFPPEGRVDS